uniref:Selenoprotein P-like n=1 Tax=Crassostrea virginica TaxID=6565 RepID=A0A8B8CHD9_CRAVI|nr:selenoprotein P-like [Crassostrea virginica]
MCQQQAEDLERLKTSYENIGMTDITFLIVNHVMGAASINELTSRVSFPVYQDDYNLQIQSKLNASIDDLFLYDRCGTLVYHLTKPESLVTQGTMQNKVLTTYLTNPCNCTPDTLSTTVGKTTNQIAKQQDSSPTPTPIIRRRRAIAAPTTTCSSNQ